MIAVDLLNRAAELWYAQIVPALWQSTVVALLVLVAMRLGRRWPAPLRYGLLLLALLKFVVPPAVTSPIALLQLLPQHSAIQPVPAVVEGTAQLVTPVAPIPHAGQQEQPSQTFVPVLMKAQPSWRAWMMGMYLLGAFSVVVWIVSQQRRLRRLPPRCMTVTDGELRDAFDDLCRRLGLRRRPRLLVSEHDPVPAAFGIFTPTVILPQSLVRELAPAELRVVLAHELAHHRRGDLWLNWLQIGLSAVWWFDPVYWLLSRQLRSAREDCCDDLVLARGLSSGETYCETLLRAAQLRLQRLPVGATLACGFGAHPLRRRLSRVMHASFRPAAGLSPVHLAMLLALGLVLLPGARRAGPRASTMSQPASRSTPQARSEQRVSTDLGALERSLRDLDSQDPTQRALAATQLGERGAVEAIPQLIDLLADETPIAKAPEWNGPNDWTPARTSWLQPSPGEAAAISLASLSQDAASPLIGALAHPQPAARRNAAWALGELHHPRLPGLPEVPPLVNALRDPDVRVRAAAAWALGETKDRRATQPLIAALHDRDAEVRRQSAHALGELADASAADALLDALEDSDTRVRNAAAWALDEIRDRIDDIARRRGY